MHAISKACVALLLLITLLLAALLALFLSCTAARHISTRAGK